MNKTKSPLRITVQGEFEEVYNLIDFLGERLKFAGDTVDFYKNTLSGEEKATAVVIGLYIDDNGKPKVVKDVERGTVYDPLKKWC